MQVLYLYFVLPWVSAVKQYISPFGLHHHFLSLHQNVTFSETSVECSSLETIRGWTPYRFQSPNPFKANAALSCLLPLPRATKRMRLDGWLAQL